MQRFLICLTLALLLPAQFCVAQTTGSGLFGSRTLGGGISANNSNGAFSGAPGTNLERLGEGVGEASGNERFIRDNRNAGSFVGADSGEVNNARSVAGPGQGLGGLGDLFNRFPNQQNQGQNNNNTPRRSVRVPIKIGFKHVYASPTRVGSNLSKLFSRVPQISSSKTIKVSMVGRVAILHGSVGSESERDLVGQMALLEPGISAVENQLRVDPTISNDKSSSGVLGPGQLIDPF